MIKFLNVGCKDDACHYVAVELLKEMMFNERPVLGMATGGTMEVMYHHLTALVKKNQVDIKKLETFNLDEYYMLDPNDPNSYLSYMKHHFFDKVGMTESQYHLPYNQEENLEEQLEHYERMTETHGPFDIQLLGIGENGHIGFNEPGTPFTAETRCVALAESTINANARFFNTIDDVPTHAVTMGIDTIMAAKRIILLAIGEKKAEILSTLYQMDAPDEQIPASVLLNHPNVEIIMDDEAAALIK